LLYTIHSEQVLLQLEHGKMARLLQLFSLKYISVSIATSHLQDYFYILKLSK
jgi:hypothetical protein